MRINQNVAALNAYRHLSITDNRLNRSLERLSSGLRINRAADDAAGLAISEKMRAQISGLRMAMRNAQDGISLMQSAEGAIQEIHSMLQRMRELAVQAANETYTSADRMEIQKEIEQLKLEVNRISSATEFNTKKLLDGSSAAIVSTDSTTTHVYMRDGLRRVDEFGQKIEGGGNYRIDVQAQEIGSAQVQKSNIFMVKHAEAGKVAEDEHVGSAIFSGTILNTLEQDVVATVSFKIDGVEYSVSHTGTAGGDTPTELAEALRDLINSEPGLTDLVTASSAAGILTVVRDEVGEDFAIGWEIGDNAGANTTIAGSQTQELTTVSPADTNIQEMSFNAVNFLTGSYTVNTNDDLAANANAEVHTAEYSRNDVALFDATPTSLTAANAAANLSLSLEVTAVDDVANQITVSYSYYQTNMDGTVSTGSGTRTLATGANNDEQFGGVIFDTFTLEGVANFEVGDRMVVNSSAHADGGGQDGVNFLKDGAATANFVFTDNAINDSTQTFNFYQLDEDTGELVDSAMDLTFGTLSTETSAAGFTIREGEQIGHLATENTRLYDIREFWDANGRFLLENPRTITIVQGDGKQTFFTIDRNDTLGSLREKINKAISDEKPQYLGQTRYVEGAIENQFAEYISTAGIGHRSVQGTLIVRSVVPGRQGELAFFGSADIINALGFQTVQQSTETIFEIKVTDAHSAEVIDENVRISSNLMVGVVHPNVDVEFDPLAGMTKVTELDGWGNFNIERDINPLTTFIHLKDSTMIFQIGPNPGQDVGAAIGRMDSRALGIHGILVTDRLKANEAIDFLDRAMDLVSGERSKLGAVQNRLEHTVNSLSVAIENLSASESRIRDLDVAQEMVEFTKNQILMQAGTAMLAQANMKPQAILQLLG